jgi:hypothetical protein
MIKLLLLPLLLLQSATFFNQNVRPSGGSGPPLTSLLAWYKADSLSATPVPSWTDSSGNGHTMVNVTTADQPTWSASQINGLPALGLNGSTQSLGTLTVIPYSGNVSIYVVWKCAAVAGTNDFDSSASGQTFVYRINAGHQEALYQGVAVLGVGTATVTNGTWYKSAVTYNQTSGAGALYLNGVADGTFTSVQTIPQGIDVLFNSGNVNEYFNGQVAEVLIYSTSTYQAAVDTYLHGRYGL